MGYISKVSCRCGYEREFRLGTGRRLPDAARINKDFPDEKLKEFREALEAGRLGPLFYTEQIMAYCDRCKDLKEGRVLHYQDGGKDRTEYDFCHTCGHELRPAGEAPLCPKCGKKLQVKMGGQWD